jgi:predicted N-acetyltransferase YhbS
MVTIRNEAAADVGAREALLDRAFGEDRFQKASERLREGRLPAEGLSFVAAANAALIGTVRLWHVTAGPARPALLLGPLAVDAEWRGRGVGGALMRHAIEKARGRGHAAILLVGDASYYARFGFNAEATKGLWLPGPYDRRRLLAREFVPGAIAGARGLIGATGSMVPKRREHVTARIPRERANDPYPARPL